MASRRAQIISPDEVHALDTLTDRELLEALVEQQRTTNQRLSDLASRVRRGQG